MRVQEETRTRKLTETRFLEDLKNLQDTIIKTGGAGELGFGQEVMQTLYKYLFQANSQVWRGMIPEEIHNF